MTTFNQESIRMVWGFLFKEEEYPLSYEEYNKRINTSITQSNIVYVMFNNLCYHNNNFYYANNQWNVISPMSGFTVYRKHRNIRYIDILEEFYKKNNEIINCEQCHITFKNIINKGNDIFEIMFMDVVETDYLNDCFYNNLNNLIKYGDPYKIDDELLMILANVSINEPFKYDTDAKYIFT